MPKGDDLMLSRWKIRIPRDRGTNIEIRNNVKISNVSITKTKVPIRKSGASIVWIAGALSSTRISDVSF